MRLPARPASIASACALLLAACNGSDGPPDAAGSARPTDALPAASVPDAPRPDGPAGIDWFGGDIDAAFSAARSAGEPVLLYWGAEWCPYCEYLDGHVFSGEDVRQ